MSDVYWMRQCILWKPDPSVNGGSFQTSWIPEKFAKKGKVLELKEGDKWEDGWKVYSVGARAKNDIVHRASMAHTRQRGKSDI